MCIVTPALLSLDTTSGPLGVRDEQKTGLPHAPTRSPTRSAIRPA